MKEYNKIYNNLIAYCMNNVNDLSIKSHIHV